MSRLLRWLAVGSAAVLVAGGAGTSSVGALDVGVTVPGVGGVQATVTTPTVTVPSLPSPPKVTSPVPVPTVTAPTITAPTIPTPTVTSPTLTAPTVSPAPLPVAPAGTASTPAPADALAPVSSSANGSSGNDGSSAAGASAAGAEAGTPGAATTAGDAGVGRGVMPHPPGTSSGAASAAPRSTADIKQTVAALHQCLGELGASERRVLVLRAGSGPGAPLTRRQVARRLDLGVTQTGRIERRGLRRLDRLAGDGACGGAAGGSEALSTNIAHSDATAIFAGGGAATGLPRFGVGGVVAHGGGDDGSKDSGGRSALGLPPPIGSGGEATLLVALGLLLVLALLVRRELPRR